MEEVDGLIERELDFPPALDKAEIYLPTFFK